MIQFKKLNRRHFLKNATILASTVIFPGLTQAAHNISAAKRKFRLCLNPGAIGVQASQKELLQMAIEYGYEAIISMPDQLLEYGDSELSELTEEMKTHNISWGSASLPVDFRKDEDTFKKGLEKLPAYAKVLENAGATRMNTWISNGHNELPYMANFHQHKERLGNCAKILGEHGVRLGLEYVGPKTSMTRRRYPFMRTMGEVLELIAAIGEPNMGLVLDSFHWFCAEDTADDIRKLTPSAIVTCDLNDARADLSRDEQIDGTRELPASTGVIDLKAFLQALIDMGYDGPVRAEPFNKNLNKMDNEEALKVSTKAMKQAVALIE